MASPSPDAASSDATTPPASVDLYRDTPVRFLGYANELGESFKPLIPRVAYLGTYGVACAYVAADANDKYRRDGDVARGVDALIWQALASVIVPGFVVNRVVAMAGRATTRPMVPTFCGLASIPLIIKPIDHAVDAAIRGTTWIVRKESSQDNRRRRDRS